MADFCITRYYLEDAIPYCEKTWYHHAGGVDVEGAMHALDPRAVPLSALILAVAHADFIMPNLWFATMTINSACDVVGELQRHDGEPPPGHWFWNPVDDGPPRRGVTFVSRDEYESHCDHMRKHAELAAKSREN